MLSRALRPYCRGCAGILLIGVLAAVTAPGQQPEQNLKERRIDPGGATLQRPRQPVEDHPVGPPPVKPEPVKPLPGPRPSNPRPDPPAPQPSVNVNLPVIGIVLAVLGIAAAGLWAARSRPSAPAAPSRQENETPEPPRSAGGTPPVAGSPQAAKTIFISYRREDSADIVGRISDRLVQRFGHDSVFKDVDSIPLGYDFRKHLQRAVGRCSALLVIIGRTWCEARGEDGTRRLDDSHDYLRIEIEAALEREIPVVPVLVQGATMPSPNTLPPSMQSLAYRHALSVRPDPDFNTDVDRLIRGIEAAFTGPARA